MKTLVRAFSLLLLWVSAAWAQTPEPLSGIHGLVLDAESGSPIKGASVSLESLPSGTLPTESAGVAGFVPVARSVTTDRDGRYRFSGLVRGGYRLRVVRLGYHPASLDVHYDAPADPRISVGLEIHPIELEGVVLVGSAMGARTGLEAAGAGDDSRVARHRMRQARHAQGDIQELTPSDVADAVTLGETDLLRALQRLPGVVADDDWSAEPWTRGSRWDETRIYLDGFPLYDPLHGGGAFTSLSADLVGRMTFFPGVRPASAPDAAAGLVDLRTRSATGAERLSALAQLSLLSGRITVDRPLGPGSGITFSGRRTYIDEVTRNEPVSQDRIPYRFTDLGGRWDQRLGTRFRLELSALRTEDRVLGDVPHAVKGARGRWGNSLIQGTLQMERWSHRFRLTTGTARYDAHLEGSSFDADREDLLDASTAAPLDNAVDTDITELTVEPMTEGGASPRWAAGWRSTSTAVAYRGPAAWPFPGSAADGGLRFNTNRTVDALWGTLRESPRPDVDLTLGLRLESTGDHDPVLVSPRVAGVWKATPDLRVSAGIGRHYQFQQAVAGAGFQAGPGLVPTHLWLSVGDGVPSVRADLITLGAERWIGAGVLAGATLYHRRSEGHVAPRPDSGFVRASPVVANGAIGAGWATSTGTATGLELSLRRLSGRWTGAVSYAVSRARRQTDQTTVRAPGDRTHALDASLAWRATPRTRVGATLAAATGVPFTRFFSFRCPDDPHCPPVQEGLLPVIGFNQTVGAERAPSYASVDAHVQREGTLFGLPFGLFVQVRNLLGRDNVSSYLGSRLICTEAGECAAVDSFEDGMPRLPLLGFWIRM